MALLSPKVMNFAYGMGAAVVIIGALFKIAHFEIGPLTGTVMLTIGLVTEAAIFAISAFEEPAKELDWSLVYPELAGGETTGKKEKKEDPKEAQGLLSQKLDAMLKEAKIDGELMSSLGNSIKNFEGAAKSISPTVDAMAGQKKYADEMMAAASNMESLNSLYKAQLDSASRNAEANKEIAENAAKLKEQMQSMTANIASLNNVYGGMLSAMSNRG
ncbi:MULTISPECIES: gliding motility protein GldL [Flavobacterium]|uniref:Gliding motility protein GldL n=1 Tax=Flavobacterium hankyongi TaxID=1176532 RepID=A0ABP8ZUL2_9FLAO|nr:gliding motility protein GldL [Flavobacterium sp. N1846]